jgi:hypothetical protein
MTESIKERIWLTLRDEGGYWSARELLVHLRENDPGGIYHKRNVSRTLNALVRDGCVVSRPSMIGIEIYGVTLRCRAP